MTTTDDRKPSDQEPWALVEAERQAYWDEIQPDLALFRATPEEVEIRKQWEPIVPFSASAEPRDFLAMATEMED